MRIAPHLLALALALPLAGPAAAGRPLAPESIPIPRAPGNGAQEDARRDDAKPGADATEVARLAEALRRAGADERDELFSALDAVAKRRLVGEVLAERWEEALAGVRRGSTLGQIGRLAEQRRDLDGARKRAFDLIEDEERYFYPYRVPAVPSDQASRYPAVQADVDELVDEVRKLWEKSKKVRPPKAFRQAADELAWNAARQDEIRSEIALPEDLPEWIFGLPDDVDAVTLATFGWDEEERDLLAYGRAVRALNQEAWTTAPKDRNLPELARPQKSEMRQVEITNDYRVMMGRVPLLWNTGLMEACQGHSDYMSRWGVLSHYEDKNPERYDVKLRAALVGYTWVSGENCSMGRADPKSAFEGWFSSSGHHRNMLAAHHREMASAESGGYWTQNFGTREPSAEELDQ